MFSLIKDHCLLLFASHSFCGDNPCQQPLETLLYALRENEDKKADNNNYRGNRFKVMNLLEESQVPEHTVRAITLGSNLRVEFTVRGSTGVHISV